MNLRFVTWNIHKGFSSGNQRFTLHRAGECLRLLRPDVVLLQEVQGEHRQRRLAHANWPEHGQATHLAQAITHAAAFHAYGANAQHAHGHHGNAVLSVHPLLEWTNHDLSNHRFESRGLLHTRISVLHRIVHVLCCHLDLTAWGRQRQLDMIVQVLKRDIPPTDAVALAGDFNDWNQQADARLRPYGFCDAYRQLHGTAARTFPAWWPLVPLDRLYLRGLIPHAAACPHGPPWRGISDHLPLVVDVTLPSEISANHLG